MKKLIHLVAVSGLLVTASAASATHLINNNQKKAADVDSCVTNSNNTITYVVGGVSHTIQNGTFNGNPVWSCSPMNPPRTYVLMPNPPEIRDTCQTPDEPTMVDHNTRRMGGGWYAHPECKGR